MFLYYQFIECILFVHCLMNYFCILLFHIILQSKKKGVRFADLTYADEESEGEETDATTTTFLKQEGSTISKVFMCTLIFDKVKLFLF